MRITAVPRALFWFVLSKKQLAVLMWLSEAHYDGRCRSYSRPGGLLHGYLNTMTYWESDEPHQFKADWSDLDIMCKILECKMGLSKEDIDVAVDLYSSFRGAITNWSNISQGLEYEVHRDS